MSSTGAGKGDKVRPHDKGKYNAGYDRIFGGDRRKAWNALRGYADEGLMTIAAVKAKPPTVGDLVSELSKYDKDATVVIRSEYGDRNEAFLASEYVGLDDPDDFHWSWLNTDDGEQDYVAIYSQGWNYDKL